MAPLVLAFGRVFSRELRCSRVLDVTIDALRA